MSRHRLFLDSPTQVGKNRITLPPALANYYGNTATAFVNGRQVESQTGGYALSFDGVDDYVLLPSFSLPSNFTIRVFGSFNLNRHFFGYRTLSNIGYTFSTDETGKIRLIVYGVGTYSTTSTYDIENANSLSVTYNGSSVAFYMNGEFLQSIPASFTPYTQVWNYYIGATNYNGVFYPFTGKINNFAIWNTALSSTNITKNIIGTESGLIVHYKMDEGSGTTLTDSAGSNNGTITGATWEFTTEKNSTDAIVFTTPTPTRELEIGRGNLELTDTSSANEVGVLHWAPSSDSGYYWVLTEDESGNTVYVKVAGTWVEGQLFIKVDGSWKQASDINVKSSGTWK